MLDKTQVTKLAVAGFGAAMASVYAIPEAHATIIPITFAPGSVPYVNTTSSPLGDVDILTATAKHVFIMGLPVHNSTGGKAIVLGTGSSLVIAPKGQVIQSSTFVHKHFLGGPSATGTDYVGFKPRAGGGVGWFEVDWGGSKGTIKFLKGAYNPVKGGSIVVGPMPGIGGVEAPEPSELGLFALGLLALGAAGVRMRRDARKAAELN